MRGAEGPRGPVIALAGNPNVGKSTLFNALTGLRQHTGNWPGKTVEVARGACVRGARRYELVDLPGTYSLKAHSPEEEVARDFLCWGGAQAAVVVCDAAALERGLNLALQTLELLPRTLVCVNLMDQARRRGIGVDLEGLSRQLGAPVVGISAGRGEGLEELLTALDGLLAAPNPSPRPVPYLLPMERALDRLTPLLPQGEGLSPRRAALALLGGEACPGGTDLAALPGVEQALKEARAELEGAGLGRSVWEERVAYCLVRRAEAIAARVVRVPPQAARRDRRLDRLFLSPATGVPVMLLLLAGIFYLTIWGANYPSQLLSHLLFRGQDALSALFVRWGAPEWLHGALVLGVYRVVAWVVSVMLPPMAIFFPLFTLLEDFGYLPRVAFVLDRAFEGARACGKQSLCMAMGLGCNAAGVTGARIIDSPRERLIAVLTNSFVPCNGRFPTLIALITLFFAGSAGGWRGGLLAAAILTGVIVLGVGMTFALSRLLSATLLRGVPSAFALELPPYRAPRVGQVLVRSVLDRTLFVLGRAAAVAAPAGLVIWLFANLSPGGVSLLGRCAQLLDPFARLLGLDGVILMGFLLGFPANEIVLPVILMGYLSTGTLAGYESLEGLHQLLLAQGWTWLTALCTLLLCLMHWPCSTTCLTIARETGSPKWAALAAALPTGAGMLTCFLTASAARLLGLA